MVEKKVVGMLFVAIVIIGGFLNSCNKKQQKEELEIFPRSETLYLSGFLWGPPSTFNPLSDDPAFPNTGNCNLVYESMFGYNSLTGEIEGILAKDDYIISDGMFTVFLNEDAMWSNGEPLTSSDVLYTFNLHKKYPTSMESHWQYIDDIFVDDAHTITFKLSEEKYNPLTMKDIVSSTFIMPECIYKDIEEKAIEVVRAKTDSGEIDPAAVLEIIREYKDDKPVASGPYTIHSYNDNQVVLERVDSYWGKIKHGGELPPPVYIIHPIYKSNDDGNNALEKGQLDLSQNFIPQIWNKFSKGVGTWYKERPYYNPGTIPCMLMALLDKPFTDLAFRRAVAHAIDYENIRTTAIYGYAPKLKSGLIIPQGPELQYFNEYDVQKYGVSFDPERARSILKDAGYTWGVDSMLVSPEGERLSVLKVTCPSGWTDWESTVGIFVEGLLGVGIDVKPEFLEWGVFWQNLINGEFDFTMWTPLDYQTASLPWSRFAWVMSSDEWAPKGEAMWNGMGRYKNDKADSLLTILPKLTDDAEIVETYRELNIKFMKEMPVIPLMYRPWFFYEFSTKHWTNFPTNDNPRSPPQCLVVGAGIKGLWELKLVENDK